MAIFYAHPYDLSATGFTFEDAETYRKKIGSIRNDYGQPVEEFEIQFIDGAAIDCDLAKAWGINQANILRFMAILDAWDEDQKTRFIVAVGEAGYGFDPDAVDPDDYDVDVYYVDSLEALAREFVEEGLFGDIPEQMTFYLDYEHIARDLRVDYAETEIAGQDIVYRCA